MNIVLIGMRGSGKSTVAKLLAKKLDKPFYDLDAEFAKQVGMPLPEFINKNGWDVFRDKESEVVEAMAPVTNAIIATGGGIVLREKNVHALKQNGKLIFLKTSIDEMLKRIGNDQKRPALTDKKTPREEMEAVRKERKSLYEKAADITIETDEKTTETIANEIVNKL